ncbi:MAG TPA: hypothetical protein VFW03_09375, partial [Gemmatimonadaceae bacterium]|nr:hypothetical protein [Gemmatimonadaceae bacterium]
MGPLGISVCGAAVAGFGAWLGALVALAAGAQAAAASAAAPATNSPMNCRRKLGSDSNFIVLTRSVDDPLQMENWGRSRISSFERPG